MPSDETADVRPSGPVSKRTARLGRRDRGSRQRGRLEARVGARRAALGPPPRRRWPALGATRAVPGAALAAHAGAAGGPDAALVCAYVRDPGPSSGVRAAAVAPTQPDKVEVSRLTPSRAK